MSRRLLARSIAFALTVSVSPLFAAPPPGQLDPTFGPTGGTSGVVRRGFDLGDTPPLKWDDSARAMAEDGQGRLILVGTAAKDSGHCVGLMRFTVDGLPDVSFGTNGKICLDNLGSIAPSGLIARSDGGLYFIARTGTQDQYKARVCSIDAQGLPIESFGIDLSGCVTLVDLNLKNPLPGMLLIGEDTLYVVANHFNGTIDLPVLRKLDPASGAVIPFGNAPGAALFPLHGEARPSVMDIALSEDGRLFVAGSIDAGANDRSMLVAAFNPQSGQPDMEFAAGLLSLNLSSDVQNNYDGATSIEVLNDGRILVAGVYSTNASGRGFAVVRLDADSGALDDSYGDAIIMHDPCSDIPDGCLLKVTRATRTAGGSIVVGGDIGNSGEGGYMYAARLLPDGSPDSSFGSPLGIRHLDDLPGGDAAGMAVQGERVVLGGTSTKVQTVFVEGGYQQIQHADFTVLRLSDGYLFKDEFESQ